MIRFLGRRFVLLVLELVAVSLGAFLIVHLAPGNPAVLMAGLHPTPAVLRAVTREWGLDKPLTTQYLTYMGQLVHGRLGYSMMDHHSVASLIAAALPVTLTIGAGGTVGTFPTPFHQPPYVTATPAGSAASEMSF